MGASTSTPETLPIQLQMEGPPNYPDMNVIFKGIPKMMQVADDMHRMTNYIMDLRNMTLGLSIVSIIGMFLFLLLKYVQGKNSRRRRRRLHMMDSDQTSLNRTGDVGMGNGSSGTMVAPSTRYYSQKHPSHYVNNLDWNSSRHVPIDMEKLLESQHSNSTAHHINNNHTNSNAGNNNNGTFHRQTPPSQYVPFSRNLPYGGNHHHFQLGQSTLNGVTAGSAASGTTSTTVALSDLNNDLTDQNELPYSSAAGVTSTAAANLNHAAIGSIAVTSNGMLSSGHPLVITNSINSSQTPTSTNVTQSAAHPIKVSRIPSVVNVFNTTK